MWEDLRSLLVEAWRLSELVESRVTSRQRTLLQISCSVRILLETLNSTHGLQLKNLSSTRRYSFGRRWLFEFSTGLIHGWKISTAKAIKYKMVERGWCPARVDDFSRKFSGSTLHFLSGLPLSSEVSHAVCTASRCIAYNIDESRYVPRYTKTVVVKQSVLRPNSLRRPLHLLLKMILEFLLCHVQSVAMGHYRLKLPGLGQVWNM